MLFQLLMPLFLFIRVAVFEQLEDCDEAQKKAEQILKRIFKHFGISRECQTGREKEEQGLREASSHESAVC